MLRTIVVVSAIAYCLWRIKKWFDSGEKRPDPYVAPSQSAPWTQRQPDTPRQSYVIDSGETTIYPGYSVSERNFGSPESPERSN